MGYRDDFYCVANIIGYSGNLNKFPTVYFQSAKEYGHITQQHPSSQNVGRQAVEDAAGYSIGNEQVGGVLKLLEKKNGRVFHESRSTLSKVGPGDAQTLAIVSQAVWKCTDEKYISDYSENDFDVIDETMDAKAKMQAQLLSKTKKV